MSTEGSSLTSRLSTSALSLLTESTASETTASRARSASSELTSLAPTPKKPRWDASEQPARFYSPVKDGAVPTPAAASNSSQSATLALATRPPVRRMARPSSHYSRSQPQDDGKEYLQAGLYWTGPAVASSSSTSPPPEPQRPNRSASIRARKADLEWRKLKQPAWFPLPMYHGAAVLKEERDFRLSFNVLRDGLAMPRVGKGVKLCKEDEDEWRAAERLRLESSQKPPPYRSIRQNFYVERKPEKSDHPAVCVCELPSDPDLPGCREDCMNRLMQYICDKKTCPCGTRCSNVPLNERQSIPEGKEGLKVVWTGDRGFGLKTMVPVIKGQFIMEYRGEIIGRDEAYKRVLTTYKDAKGFYFLDYDGHEVIDAGQKGNASRFINHSCSPNVKVVSWKMASMEEFQMGIFALQDIPAGTELTYDYGWQDFSAVPPNPNASPPPPEAKAARPRLVNGQDPSRQRCYCGAEACSGFLGGKKKELSKKELAAAARAPSSAKKGIKTKAGNVPPSPQPKSKATGSLKAALEKIKEVVASKKTSAKLGAGKVTPKAKPASTSSRPSLVIAPKVSKKPATPLPTTKVVITQAALLTPRRAGSKIGAKVAIVRTSPRKASQP